MNELKTVSNKNLLIQNPRLSLNLSEKFISNTISPRLKKTSTILTPNGSFLKSLKTLKLEKKPSTKLIVSSSKKLSYENSIAQLKLPTTPDIVINTIPNLPNWIKQDLIEYEQIYYISKKEKSCVPYNDFSEEFNANIGDDVLYRYEILDVLGKGSFGQVFKVLDHATGNTLALKVIKNKQVYLEQSIIEIEILKYLHEKNNNAHSNFVKFEGNFYFRNHMCLSFELLSLNLYELIKINNFKGLPIQKIKKIAGQVLRCLSFISKHNIIHCDLKPENILLKDPNSSLVKVIDFGSSCFSSQKVYSYIQSRFYRAPEIVLEIPYTPAIDMWSFGCILVELYTGLPIFPAENEKELISCIAEVLGEPNYETISNGNRSFMYFTKEGKIISHKNRKGIRRVPGGRNLRKILKGADEDFIALISECLQWDYNTRLTPEKALKSPWLADSKLSPKIYTRHCKVSLEDIIKHTPKLKKLMSNNKKPFN